MEKLKYMCELIKKNAVATCRKWIPYYQENGWNRSLLRFERSLMFAHHYCFEIMNMVWCGVALNLASSVVPITPVAFLPFFSIPTCPKWLWRNYAGSMTKYFLLRLAGSNWYSNVRDWLWWIKGWTTNKWKSWW